LAGLCGLRCVKCQCLLLFVRQWGSFFSVIFTGNVLCAAAVLYKPFERAEYFAVARQSLVSDASMRNARIF
jgi:hypothetical protein